MAGEEDGGKSRMAAAVATRVGSRAFAPCALDVGRIDRPTGLSGRSSSSVTNRRGSFDLRSGGTTR